MALNTPRPIVIIILIDNYIYVQVGWNQNIWNEGLWYVPNDLMLSDATVFWRYHPIEQSTMFFCNQNPNSSIDA